MDDIQQEMYEYALLRIKKKKRLYFHFVLLFVGSIFLFVAQKFTTIAPNTNWHFWIISVWLFIFILHFIKVFITDSFMNKKWERHQIDRLVRKQEKRIEQLKIEIENK